MTNLNYSNIDMDGINNSSTSIFHGGIAQVNDINQNYTQNSRTTSVSTNVTYTEPLGNFFYAQAEYTYSWMRSESEKYTYEADGTLVPAYTNAIINESGRHSAGVNVLFQNSKVHAQVGFSIQPNKNRNYTQTGASYQVDTTIRMLNWSPQAMIILSPNDFANIRINYRGNSGQPSTSQLISVPDNSNPLSMSFGNPNLSPYFSHNFGVTFRHTNRMTFSSYNVSLNGGFVQNPIVNSSWYTNGISYTMPMNGPTTLNGGVNAMINSPIARSDFSIFNMVSGNYSQAASYVGANINTPQYVDADGALNYAKFFTDYDRGLLDFTENSTKTVSANERFRLMYRPDNLELSLNAGTNFRKSWYSISSMADQTTTWNNSVGASIDWSFSLTGMRLRADYNYNWYRGYTTPQPDEHILNATIEKLLFNNTVTLTLSANDILGQSKNLMVSDTANYHTESTNNTLGRYIMVSLSYRFGTFGRRGAGRGGNGGGMGGGFGGGRGGGRGMRM